VSHPGIGWLSDPLARVTVVGDLLFLSVGPRRGMRKGTSALAWYERGCQLESSDPTAAIAAYERALRGRPDLADAHNNLGRLLHDGGDLAGAEAHYRLALCAGRYIALYWFNLGVVLEDTGRGAEAIDAYERAIAIDAKLADAHFNLARQIERVARLADDEILLRRAVRHLKQYRELSRASG
jgi:tetratricopeptide (TPR) repeat protein